MKDLKQLLLPALAGLIQIVASLIVNDYVDGLQTDTCLIKSKLALKILLIALVALLLILTYFIIKYINKYIEKENNPHNLEKKEHMHKMKINIKKLSIFEKNILRCYYIKPNKEFQIFSEYSNVIGFVKSLCEKSILYTTVLREVNCNPNPKLKENIYFIDKFAFNYLENHSRTIR